MPVPRFGSHYIPATKTSSPRETALLISSNARQPFPDPGGPDISRTNIDLSPPSDEEGATSTPFSFKAGAPVDSSVFNAKHGVVYVRGLASGVDAGPGFLGSPELDSVSIRDAGTGWLRATWEAWTCEVDDPGR